MLCFVLGILIVYVYFCLFLFLLFWIILLFVYIVFLMEIRNIEFEMVGVFKKGNIKFVKVNLRGNDLNLRYMFLGNWR